MPSVTLNYELTRTGGYPQLWVTAGQLTKVGAGWGFHQVLGGPLDGPIHGDIFTFTLISGNAAQGQATVSGDDVSNATITPPGSRT